MKQPTNVINTSPDYLLGWKNGQAALVPPQFTTAQAAATQALVSDAGNVIVADLTFSGASKDATAYLQGLINAASAAYSAAKGRWRIIVPTAIWMVDGLIWAPNIILDLTDATLRKRVTGAGVAFGTTCDNRHAVIRTKEILVGGTTYYGNYDNITLIGGTLDAGSFFMSAGILNALNVRNFEVIGTKIIRQGTQAFWSTMIGGQNITIRDIQTSGGTIQGQDGLHLCFGSGIRVYGGYYEAGDDGIACGFEDLGALYDDEALTDVAIVNPIVKSFSAFAFKAYYKPPSGGSLRGLVRNVRVTNLMGSSGLLVNGGIGLYDHSAVDSRDASRVSDIHITCNISCGSTAHSGTVPAGVMVQAASDWSITGKIAITDSIGGATRWTCGELQASVRGTVNVDWPLVPALGGLFVRNLSTTVQQNRDNRIGGSFKFNASSTIGGVILASSPGTVVAATFIDIPNGLTGIRANGNTTATVSTLFAQGCLFRRASGATSAGGITSVAAGRLQHASIVGCDFADVDTPLDASFATNVTTRSVSGNRNLANAEDLV